MTIAGASEIIPGQFWDKGGAVFNCMHPDWGVKGDLVAVAGGAMTAGSAVLTMSGSTFVPADVGKLIRVPGAAAIGGVLASTISSYTSATQVTLADTASLSVSGKTVKFGTDDGLAFRAFFADVLSYAAARGATAVIPPRRYLVFSKGTAYTSLADFVDIENLKLLNHGGVLEIDPARSGPDIFTTSYGQFFTFSDVGELTVDGFNVTGPSTYGYITAPSVRGVGFASFGQGCRGIKLPHNKLRGVQIGVIFNRLYTETESNRCSNIQIGVLDVSYAFYAAAWQNSGDNTKFGTIRASNCHRSIVAYGVDDLKGTVRQTNIYDGSVYLHVLDGQTTSGIRIKVIDKDTLAASDLNNKVSLLFANQTPSTIRDVDIEFAIEYHTGAMTSGSAVLTSGAAAFSAGDVGKNIVVTGAGAAGADLTTTILTFTSERQVTLSATASTTVTAAVVTWGAQATGGAMTAANALLTIGSALFTQDDEGKAIVVPGAGAAGAPLSTYIQSVSSTTQVVLATVASTTVSGKTVTYGSVLGQNGARSLFIGKTDNGGNPDTTDRGHTLANLTLRGHIQGNSHNQAGGMLGMDTASTFGTGDFLRNPRMKAMRLKASRYCDFALGWLVDQFVLHGVTSDDSIRLRQSTAGFSGTLSQTTGNGNIVATGCSFPNLYEFVGAVSAFPILHRLDGNAITIPAAWMNGTFIHQGTVGALKMDTLPPATPGLTATFARVASFTYRLDPNGTEIFRGHAAGKYMELGSDGANATIKCFTAGIWDIITTSGTVTFEP